jgi:CheY-like chemotaxis protein
MRALEVLVVEDDPDMQVILAEILRFAGHSVQCAGNGLQALECMAEGWHPQLIVLDIVMPVMDGFAFLRRKMASRELGQIPVVVVSATAEPPIEGVRRVLRKPIEPQELIVAVDHCSAVAA